MKNTICLLVSMLVLAGGSAPAAAQAVPEVASPELNE